MMKFKTVVLCLKLLTIKVKWKRYKIVKNKFLVYKLKQLFLKYSKLIRSTLCKIAYYVIKYYTKHTVNTEQNTSQNVLECRGLLLAKLRASSNEFSQIKN